MTITRRKLFNGMFEIRDYEREAGLKTNGKVKLVLEIEGEPGQEMILTHKQLKNGKFINTQYSKFKAQTYGIWGYEWKPSVNADEQVSINTDVMQRLAQERTKYGI